MCWKNLMIWKKKLKMKVRTIIKQCHLNAWSAEKIQKVKIQRGRTMSCQNVQFATLKNQNLANSKKLMDY